MFTLQTGEAKRVPWLRLLCFFACVPSGGALLAKVYGLASMRTIVVLLALPCCLGLVAIWIWARSKGKEQEQLTSALEIGFVGGLFGTIGYDLSRIPFHIAGQRVFAPISAYGIWIVEAASSTRLTETAGWAYHFSNGITFGVMYALFMRGRHWGWAIVWALTLETIAVVSPFARIFHLSGNYKALGIAYFGHLAYGLPLGWLIYKWNETRNQLAATPVSSKWMLVAATCVLFLWPLASLEGFRRDARVTPGEFRVEGVRLNPDWVRLEHGGAVRIHNPEPQTVSVRVKQTNTSNEILTGASADIVFPQPGIYQIFIENKATTQNTQSSFVIVEPVEEFK